MYITDKNLQNVLFKFSLQNHIKNLQKANFTCFFAISTNCNYFKILFGTLSSKLILISPKKFNSFGPILKMLFCFKKCANINVLHCMKHM